MVDLLWKKLMGGLQTVVGKLWVSTGNLALLDWFWSIGVTKTGLSPILDKIVQGVVKSTTLSPLVGGGVRGNPGIGKGSTSWKPFGKDLW